MRRDELAAAEGRTIPDVIGPGLRVLFCGINPGLWSAAVGHHFAHPSNRFWKVLHQAGFTDRLLPPAEQGELAGAGVGITNLVDRSTRTAKELSAEELRAGASALEDKVRRYRPTIVAVVGVQAYRTGFGRRHAVIGPQSDSLAGSRLWVVANPSGAQAHYPLAALVEAFTELRLATTL
ncbi:MAG: G/U mismatch-specific DNA glycosylase [Actinomycetota bacterium]|nr:G/U mismatch-specific DNA glycosylase [Actinomycetota bacterium]